MGITTAKQAASFWARPAAAPQSGTRKRFTLRAQARSRVLPGLGFAHGVGSVYIAAALEAQREGAPPSVDTIAAHDRDPVRAVADRQSGSCRTALTSSTSRPATPWFLHDKLREQLRDNAIEPLYDFVFIDGAHTWDADALAFELVDRLLKPGGWILLDDLDWTLDDRWPDVPEYQKAIPQIRSVWELLALTNPQYDRFETEGQWGWMRKSADPAPQTRTLVKRDLVGSVREVGRLARRKLRRAPPAAARARPPISASLTISGGRNRSVVGPVALTTSRCSVSARRTTAGASTSSSTATIRPLGPGPRARRGVRAQRSPAAVPCSRTASRKAGSSTMSSTALAAATPPGCRRRSSRGRRARRRRRSAGRRPARRSAGRRPAPSRVVSASGTTP